MSGIKVAILDTVFIQDSRVMIHGGAERYLIEFHRLLRRLGYDPTVWQLGALEHQYGDISVRGLPGGEPDYGTLPALNHQFHEHTTYCERFVYFTPMLAFPRVGPRSVVISHSLFWDFAGHPWASAGGPIQREWRRRLQYAATAADLFVSVDTNMLNWLRATWPGHEHKQIYLPNFVDTGLFRPAAKPPGPVVVLFPCRPDFNKGLNEAREAALALTGREESVAFHFVGQGVGGTVEAEMWQWARDHPGCRYEWVPPERMPEVYGQSDLVIIPSKACEGTSLACLEAMACGKPVIAGRVGGLADLIIDGYNGRLIQVTPEGLIAAIAGLIADRDLRLRMGERARETAACFSLDKWRERWTRALRAVWGDVP